MFHKTLSRIDMIKVDPTLMKTLASIKLNEEDDEKQKEKWRFFSFIDFISITTQVLFYMNNSFSIELKQPPNFGEINGWVIEIPP